MTEATAAMTVRTPSAGASVIEIAGEVTARSEAALMDAYERASGERTRAVILNFAGLEYMNSSGIGLLVTLLVRANRNKQRMLAFGLTEHYRQIFELTRLDEAIAHPRRRGRGARRGRRLTQKGAHHDHQPDTPGRRRMGAAGRPPRGDRRRARSGRINVAGRRPTSPIQGFGRMWQKTYRTPARRLDVDAARGDRGLEGALPRASGRRATASSRRSPASRRARSPRSTCPCPGGLKLSTGVLVLYADEESFTLMTPQGHMFAGWITFSAFDRGRRDVRPGAGADARRPTRCTRSG